jgi:hypothetical protein
MVKVNEVSLPMEQAAGQAIELAKQYPAETLILGYCVYRMYQRYGGGGSCCKAEFDVLQNHTHEPKGTKLAAIFEPMFNMREVCKECALLEQHLNRRSMNCHDCIRKHFLTIEGLCEEAISLDKQNQYVHITGGLPQQVRKLISEYKVAYSNKDEVRYAGLKDVAKGVRLIRKKLTPFTFFHGMKCD